MILDNEKSFEEIPEVYGGFPLKKGFIKIGNVALQKYSVKAELDESTNEIRIPFADKERFTLEELRDMWPDEEDDPNDWRVRLTAGITLSEKTAEGVTEAWCEYELIAPENVDEQDCCYDLTEAEYEQAIELIEAFLNATVDCEN